MKNYLSVCLSEELKTFLDDIKPPYNIVEIARLKLECDDDFLDPITKNVINFPVILHNRSFDFDTLDMLELDANNLAKDPFNNIPFKMSEVTPNHELHERIKHKIRQANPRRATLLAPLFVVENEIKLKRAIMCFLNTGKNTEISLKELDVSEIFLAEMSSQFNPEAQFLYAIYFEKGFNVSQSSFKYIKYLKYAVEQGLAIAQQTYAVCCELGIHGVEKDLQQAAQYYKLAANQGVAISISNYARCLAVGLGVSKNPSQAAKLFKVAADKGVATAQFDYALCCEIGFGIEKNVTDAERYYKMASEQGGQKANEPNKNSQRKRLSGV